MKINIIICVITLLSLTAGAQKKSERKMPQYIQCEVKSGSTKAYIWEFTDSTVSKRLMDLRTNRVLSIEKWKTDKPFIFMDSTGLVGYDYETDIGTMIVSYSDDLDTVLNIVYPFDPMKVTHVFFSCIIWKQ